VVGGGRAGNEYAMANCLKDHRIDSRIEDTMSSINKRVLSVSRRSEG
jgi:hypothetical protein